jgi:trehalose 6-phosphate phosphatase
MQTPNPSRDWALFLDIDGTLVDIAPGPDAICIPATLAPALESAKQWLGGALAIVSGRPFSKIDEIMTPLTLPCAGEHGAVIRLPDGTIQNAAGELAVPNAWKDCVRAATPDWSGVIVEYKSYSIAAHFRQAPERGESIRELFEAMISGNTRGFEILSAHMAFEIRNRALNKAVAVYELMKHAPFIGRVPVFVGDDVTDEDGFRAAREMGGLALHVHQVFGGKPSNVRRWLKAFCHSTT